MLTEINNKKLYIKDKVMVHTFAQVTHISRAASNVPEPVLTATVAATISNGLTNPAELGLSATQAGQTTNSDLNR